MVPTHDAQAPNIQPQGEAYGGLPRNQAPASSRRPERTPVREDARRVPGRT
jgi:hypothetical protein